MAIEGSVREIVFSRFKFSDDRSHTVQLFREQSSCQTFSQGRRVCLPLSVTQDFLSQSSWQCLASFWWGKIKAVNKGRVSINKLQQKKLRREEEGEGQRMRKKDSWMDFGTRV